MENHGFNEKDAHPNSTGSKYENLTSDQLKELFEKTKTKENVEIMIEWEKKIKREIERAASQKDLDGTEHFAPQGKFKKEILNKRVSIINNCSSLEELDINKNQLGDRFEKISELKKAYFDKCYDLVLEKYEIAEVIFINEEKSSLEKIVDAIGKLKWVYKNAPDYYTMKLLRYPGEKEHLDLKFKAIQKLGDLESDYIGKKDKLENIIHTKNVDNYDEEAVKTKLEEIDNIIAKLQEKID